MDKKIRQVETCRIFWWRWAELNSCILQSSCAVNSIFMLGKIHRSAANHSGFPLFAVWSRSTTPHLHFHTKKDIFTTFSLGLNCSVSITPKACISSKRSFVYHQGESLVYHHCEREYSLRLMICTFGDEIHAKA